MGARNSTLRVPRKPSGTLRSGLGWRQFLSNRHSGAVGHTLHEYSSEDGQRKQLERFSSKRRTPTSLSRAKIRQISRLVAMTWTNRFQTTEPFWTTPIESPSVSRVVFPAFSLDRGEGL